MTTVRCLCLASGLSFVVDGDPHFVVQLPKLSQNLCFTVDGRANDVLRLLEDPERGKQNQHFLLGLICILDAHVIFHGLCI